MFIKLTVVRTSREHTAKDIGETVAELESDAERENPDRRNRQREREELRGSIEKAVEADELDQMAFELKGYRYDRKNERIILYTPFEYRIYIPATREKFRRFIEETDRSESQGRSYNCGMLAYYSDPDFATGRSTIPVLNMGMKYLFN